MSEDGGNIMTADRVRPGFYKRPYLTFIRLGLLRDRFQEESPFDWLRAS